MVSGLFHSVTTANVDLIYFPPSTGGGLTPQQASQLQQIWANRNPWEITKPVTLTPNTWGEHVGKRLLTFLNFLGYK